MRSILQNPGNICCCVLNILISLWFKSILKGGNSNLSYSRLPDRKLHPSLEKLLRNKSKKSNFLNLETAIYWSICIPRNTCDDLVSTTNFSFNLSLRISESFPSVPAIGVQRWKHWVLVGMRRLQVSLTGWPSLESWTDLSEVHPAYSQQRGQSVMADGSQTSGRKRVYSLHPDATTLWISLCVTDIMRHISRKWHIQRNQKSRGRKFQPTYCTYMCFKCWCNEGRINPPDSRCAAHFVTSVSRNLSQIHFREQLLLPSQVFLLFQNNFLSVTEYFSVFELELKRYLSLKRQSIPLQGEPAHSSCTVAGLHNAADRKHPSSWFRDLKKDDHLLYKLSGSLMYPLIASVSSRSSPL